MPRIIHSHQICTRTFLSIHLPTSSVNSLLAVINDPSILGSNFDLENFGWENDKRSY